jgi:enoyl-[acyl-carrier protein] reductase I
MPELLTGKTALILGIANKWSLAYAIAQAFRREGATLLLTYQGERLKETVQNLGAELGAARVIECDVAKDEDLARLTETCRAHGRLDAVVHSIGFANREDLERPFSETSRAGPTPFTYMSGEERSNGIVVARMIPEGRTRQAYALSS